MDAPASPTRFLGLRSGIGLVVANMIGAGVFLSAGFMALDLNAWQILASWVVGSVLALLGVTVYGELATRSGRSGGEYRYLRDEAHPLLGIFAGWSSLLIGFSAPIAIDAFAVGAFLGRVIPVPDPRWVGTAVIVALAALHGLHLDLSRVSQNVLVGVKLLLVGGFTVVGLVLGTHALPTWTPANAHEGIPWMAAVSNQYWVAFAFSGWNGAIYAAQEFRDPVRDVPRAMLIGCASVAALYLLLNLVFVLNLEPGVAIRVAESEATQVTLSHLVAERIAGPGAARFASAMAALVLLSAASAMMLVGPRVVAEMADDGVLPRVLGSRGGQPPSGAVWLQAGLALVLLHTQTVLNLVRGTSALLMVISAATALTVFGLYRRGAPVRRVSLVAAALYAPATLGLVAVGASVDRSVALVLGGLLTASLVAWFAGSGRVGDSPSR